MISLQSLLKRESVSSALAGERIGKVSADEERNRRRAKTGLNYLKGSGKGPSALSKEDGGVKSLDH